MHARTIAIALALIVLAVPAFSAQSFLGSFSGNIVTPDAVIAPAGTWEISFHDFFNVLGDSNDLTSFGLLYGVTPDLEIGAALLNDGSSDVALSGKLRLVTETATTPSVLVGVFDVTGSADWLNEDASFFIAVSKNITAFASDVANQPSRPLRLTAGFGSGIFDGFFAGLDWTLTPQFSLMGEFVNEGFTGDSEFNAGIRYAAARNIRLDAGTIDFEDFVVGATLTSRF